MKKPRIIVVSARKGGVGKSTVAAHLSVAAGPKTMLVDADPQADEGSCASWMQARGISWPSFMPYKHFVSTTPANIIKLAQADGVETVVIDTPPDASAEVTELLRLATVNVVCTEPSFLALSALPRSLQMAAAARRPTVLVLNKVKPNRAESAQTREALAGTRLPVCEFGDLTDFGRALATGQAVHEFAPKGKAAQQVSALWETILKVTA